MAQQDYLTMTPGSAVADTLQQIMTQRQLDARQAMLDQLNASNINSEIQYRKSQADSEAANRKTLEESRQDNIWERQNALRGGQPYSGDPTQAQFGLTHGFLADDPTNPGHYTWADTEASLKRKDQDSDQKAWQRSIGSLRDAYKDNPRMTSVINSMGTNPKMGESLLNVLAQNALTESDMQPWVTYDEATHKAHVALGDDGKPIMVRRGTAPAMIPRPSTGGTPSVSKIGVNPKDNSPVFITSHLDRNGAPVVMNHGQAYDGPVQNEPSAPKAAPDVVTALTKSVPYKSYDSISKNNSAGDDIIIPKRNAAVAMISDPSLRADVQHILMHQDKMGHQLTREQLMQGVSAPPGVDPQQYIGTLDQLLYMLGAYPGAQ